MTTPGPILPMVVSGPIEMSPSDLEAARRRMQHPTTAVHRPHHLRWQVAATGFATVLVLGWLCIIALLILQERWQLVLVAWILLYTAAHFAYCYCKRNSVTNLKRQLRLRIVAQLSEGGHIIPGGVVVTEKKDDCPPSYNDAIDMEQPPPTYIMAVKHTTRNSHYSEETEVSAKNPSESASYNRDLILNPHSAVLTSTALPIAMALPFSPSTLSLTSLASAVHSSKSSTNDTTPAEEPPVKTVSEPISSSHL